MRQLRAQNNTCMCHGSGAISSLFLVCLQLKSMDAGRTSQVLQRLQLWEHAAMEQLIARRGDEHALIEVQNRIAHLDHALQQTSAGRLVDTRVLERPDKMDGSEK